MTKAQPTWTLEEYLETPDAPDAGAVGAVPELVATTDVAQSSAETREPIDGVAWTPAVLALVVARDGDRFRVRVGAQERTVGIDGSVDPALVDEAITSGARIVLDPTGEGTIVGTLSTRRAITIDPSGDVKADVHRFEVRAHDRVLLRTPRAYVKLSYQEVEVYGTRILSRARELTKILARMIKLN